MSEPRDPGLQALFDLAGRAPDAGDITDHVMAAQRRRRFLAWGGAAAALLIAVLVTWLWLAIPLLEFAVLTSEFLTTSLVDLGEGWLALLLLPINSVGGLLALLAKAAHSLRRRRYRATLA